MYLNGEGKRRKRGRGNPNGGALTHGGRGQRPVVAATHSSDNREGIGKEDEGKRKGREKRRRRREEGRGTAREEEGERAVRWDD